MASISKLKANEEPIVIGVLSMQLRIPTDLRDALKKAAHDNLRSMHNEIIWVLRQHLKTGGYL